MTGMRLMKRFVRALAATVALAAGGTAEAPAAPSHRGCPPSFTSWDVSTQPYQVDSQVDAEGNGDGFVCAKPLDSKTFQVGGQTHQIYNFIDNVAGAG
jgi:hypothetical protein